MLPRLILLLLLGFMPGVLAQALPELGDVSATAISPIDEYRLGESIMREIRRDPAYLDDPEVADYANSLGNRLVARSDASRQEFEFFLVRDPQINAFALPGGFIGIHTGLILAAQSESEVAGVVAHEIAHVTQRHIARMINQQNQSQLMSIAALAVAILAARSSSQIGEAAAVIGQAGIVQSQLNFSRDNEREADRVGLQMLEGAGFDPRGMAIFFERLQRATRIYEGGAPSYLRTHPLTFERIADIQNRIENLPYRQVPDSLDFQLIRAKLRAESGTPADAVAFFESSLAERKFLSETASRYGLVASLIRARDFGRAQKEMPALRKTASPIIENLACRLADVAGLGARALQCYQDARRVYPGNRALFYGHVEQILKAGQPAAALQLVNARIQGQPGDARLYGLQAQAYAAQGNHLMQHRSQGEAYARSGQIGAAIEQLQIALKTGGGDFYQLSATEARLRELRKQQLEQERKR
ncbi:MAG: M48 family metallopeptidase [Burkholderiales bacterium]|nr:M48 family metallopeptidase [Burkholderiales bacterium]